MGYIYENMYPWVWVPPEFPIMGNASGDPLELLCG